MLIPIDFKSNDFQVQIPKDLGAHFLQLQIVKGLRERPCRGASTGGVNPFTVNPPLKGRGGFRPPRKWLNGIRKAPPGPRKPVRAALAAASAWQFMLPQRSGQRLRILRIFLPFASLVHGLRDSGKGSDWLGRARCGWPTPTCCACTSSGFCAGGGMYTPWVSTHAGQSLETQWPSCACIANGGARWARVPAGRGSGSKNPSLAS